MRQRGWLRLWAVLSVVWWVVYIPMVAVLHVVSLGLLTEVMRLQVRWFMVDIGTVFYVWWVVGPVIIGSFTWVAVRTTWAMICWVYRGFTEDPKTTPRSLSILHGGDE